MNRFWKKNKATIIKAIDTILIVSFLLTIKRDGLEDANLIFAAAIAIRLWYTNIWIPLKHAVYVDNVEDFDINSEYPTLLNELLSDEEPAPHSEELSPFGKRVADAMAHWNRADMLRNAKKETPQMEGDENNPTNREEVTV